MPATTRRTTRSRSSTSSRHAATASPPDLERFVRFCSKLQLAGKPFILEPFQRRILRDYFGGTRQTLAILPKKNGKSTLVAALAIYHLVTTLDAEGYIAANSRDQANIILNQARKFIRATPALPQRIEVQMREIRSMRDEGFVRVLAADKDTADGVIPTLAIVDELHRAKSTDLLGVFRDGLGPRDGKMITITTAGDDSESPLGRMRDEGYAMPTVEVDGAYRYARSRSGQWVMHEWALEPEQDREDMRVVKAANPASWQTVGLLQERRDDPSTTPWQWARFACGVWLQGEDTAIGPVEWAACATDDSPPDGLTWRLGLDVGWKEDTTAIVPLALADDGAVWIADPVVLVPPAQRGVALRKREVLDAVARLAEEYEASVVVLDPENDGEVVAQDIEDELGLDVVAHSQKPAPMAQAAERFYAAVREGKLHHPRNDILTRHVLNAHRKATDDGRWRFVKENKQSRKVIDALIASAMVHNIAVEESASSWEPMAAWA
jgi:phage terminase large subunit-like protein